MRSKFLLAGFFLVTGLAAAQRQIAVEEAVAIALQKNFDVRLRQNDAAAALTDEQNSIGVFLPDINLTGSRVWNKNDQRQILANNDEVQRNGIPSNNFQGSVQLVWTLFDGTKMFATRNRFQQQADQGELLLKGQMNASAADVINNYYNIVREKQQLKAITEQMSVSEERVKLAERKLQVGTGGKPELLQAKVDLNAFRVAALQQEALIIQLKDQLNQSVAMNLPPDFEVADTIPINLTLALDEIVAGLENSNPDLLAARKGLDIAKSTLHERRAERLPVVNFVSNYNYSRTKNFFVINNFTTLFNQNRGYNYGFTASLPILNGLTIRNGIQRANLAVDKQQIFYNQQKLLATIGARVAFTGYDNARKTLEIEEENILLAKENVFIMLESFKRGIATFIELRTAQQSLQDAYNRLIAARYNAKVAEIVLLRLSGSLVN